MASAALSMRLSTAGESHGPGLIGLVEGFPAGLRVDEATLAVQLQRRQGRGRLGTGGRMVLEDDQVRWLGGVLEGTTTGAPLAFAIDNRDDWTGRLVEPVTVPRPGHADLVLGLKHAAPDLRWGLERASARETVVRVVAGALCAQALGALGLRVGSFVHALGPLGMASGVPAADELWALHARAEGDPLRCPDPDLARELAAHVEAAQRAGDTVGGVFTVFATGVPLGLGSQRAWDARLDARLMAAIGSIPGVKAVELGDAVAQARRPGSEAHDAIACDARGAVVRPTNHAGGLEGGLSNGEPIVARATFKAVSSVRRSSSAGAEPQPSSVDLRTGEPAVPRYERGDTCAVPRATIVGEAMLAWVLFDAVLERAGGDHLDQVVRAARDWSTRLPAPSMRGTPWTFGARRLSP